MKNKILLFVMTLLIIATTSCREEKKIDKKASHLENIQTETLNDGIERVASSTKNNKLDTLNFESIFKYIRDSSLNTGVFDTSWIWEYAGVRVDILIPVVKRRYNLIGFYDYTSLAALSATYAGEFQKKYPDRKVPNNIFHEEPIIFVHDEIKRIKKLYTRDRVKVIKANNRQFTYDMRREDIQELYNLVYL